MKYAAENFTLEIILSLHCINLLTYLPHPLISRVKLYHNSDRNGVIVRESITEHPAHIGQKCCYCSKKDYHTLNT